MTTPVVYWFLGCLSSYAFGWLMGRLDRETQDDPRRRFNHENRRGPVGPPPLEFRRSGDPGAISPTTPKPDIIPKPQPGRVVDARGRIVGYIPLSQGGTPNSPPTDP